MDRVGNRDYVVPGLTKDSGIHFNWQNYSHRKCCSY